jgi:hypothetical protein
VGDGVQLGVGDGVQLGVGDGVQLGVGDGVQLGVGAGVVHGVGDGVQLGVGFGSVHGVVGGTSVYAEAAPTMTATTARTSFLAIILESSGARAGFWGVWEGFADCLSRRRST